MYSKENVAEIVLLSLFAWGLIIGSGHYGKYKGEMKRDKLPGYRQIKLMETRHVGKIESQIHKKAEDKIQEKAQDPAPVPDQTEQKDFDWSFLGDTVIMGDSRVEAFKEYEFLPSAQVLADVGDHFTKIPNYKDQVVLKNPLHVVLCYGINDLGYSAWGTPEKFAEKYYELLKPLIDALPETQFYICSILPVTEAVVKKNPIYKDIPEYNKAIKDMCAEKHIGYIDCDSLVKEDIYEPNEGIHFKAAFYPVWGEYIYRAIVEK